jgi:NAD+ diphosphatase
LTSTCASFVARFGHVKVSRLHLSNAADHDSRHIWYSDSSVSRTNIPTVDTATLSASMFIVLGQGSTYLTKISKTRADPIVLTYDDVNKFIGNDSMQSLISSFEPSKDKKVSESFLAWIGQRNQTNYWCLYLPIESELVLQSIQQADPEVLIMSLREFGDLLEDPSDAAIYGTANAIFEFHRTHAFCSLCGSKTTIRNAGTSRICSNHKSKGGDCKSSSIYPRIDVASIMLITSPCEQYVLLGRKKSWPKGRYSTLAGFLEVGETMEECCIRETYEESGVQVDPSSIRFVQSQPWPFPRSLMVGFRAKAIKDNAAELPTICFDDKEMEHVAWFDKHFVAARLSGGSTALAYNPSEDEKIFHIPGKASLARVLISEWALEV